MHEAKLEHDGNDAVLKLVTHFGKSVSIKCKKTDTESFRLSFTGANEIAVCQGTITKVFDQVVAVDIGNGREIRADRVSDDVFEIGQVVWATEYYNMFMEQSAPGFVVSHSSIKEPRLLFVNVDCLDGGGNLMKRYRISPYSGAYRIVSDV